MQTNDPTVSQRKKKLYTKVEPLGVNFSPLQIKLIQIARVLLAKPKVLLLDVSFFNIEEIYERLFYALIFKNLPEAAIVCIPEREHSLAYLKTIVSMEAGRILEIIRK